MVLKCGPGASTYVRARRVERHASREGLRFFLTLNPKTLNPLVKAQEELANQYAAAQMAAEHEPESNEQIRALVEELERIKKELGERSRKADEKHWNQKLQVDQSLQKSASLHTP